MYIWIFHGKGLQIKVVRIQFMIGKSGNKVVANQKLFTVFGKSVKKKKKLKYIIAPIIQRVNGETV